MTRKQIFQYTVSFLALAFVIYILDFKKVFSLFAQINIVMIFLIYGVFLFNRLLMALRWGVLLRAQDIKTSLWQLFKITIISRFANYISPSSLAVDVVKIYKIVDLNPENKTGATMATLMSKVLGLLALVFLVMIGLLFNPILSIYWSWSLFGVTAVIMLVFCLFFWKGQIVVNFSKKYIKNEKILSYFLKVVQSLKEYKHKRKYLLWSFLLATVFQVVLICNQYLMFRALAIEVPFYFLFFAIPVSAIISMLPISAGGMGVRELSLIGLLSLAGVTSSEVVAYSLMKFLMLFLLLITTILYLTIKGMSGLLSKQTASI